jgi:hypothetical protein
LNRLLIPLALAAALALAAPAGAATTHWVGDTEGGGAVSFDLVRKHGTYKKVNSFHWDFVPATCDGGPPSFSGELLGSLRVSGHGEFLFDAKGPDGRTRIEGKIKSKHKAKGTLLLKGDFGDEQNCEKVEVEWHVSDEL